MNPEGFHRERAAWLVGFGALATALIAGFAEFRKPPPSRAGYSAAPGIAYAGQPALKYAELRNTSRGPSSNVYLASTEKLRAALPALTDEFARKPGDREEMLKSRAARRAYDGAPPVVPHPVDERAMPNCTVCHEKGAVIAGRVARAMSHPAYPSCQQCHVPDLSSHGAPGLPPSALTPNQFEPLPFGGEGTTAWQGAPPTMPHSTWMRDKCASCHGVAGLPGLRTPHAERQNCQQCHAATASKDALLTAFSGEGGP